MIIDSSLSDGNSMIRERERLAQNKGIACIGSYLQGLGFYIPRDEAIKILKVDPICAEVMKPLIRGDDIINTWDSNFPFYAINFGSRTEAEARRFTTAYKIAYEKVKPERESGKDKKLSEFWWKYKRPTLDLYATARKYDRVLAHGFVSKYVAFRFVKSDSIFAAPLVVFLSDSDGFFAVLQSALHKCWVENVSNKGSTLRYTPTDCFENFPLPNSLDDLVEIGAEYNEKRDSIIASRQMGLTNIYNLFHDPCEKSEDIETFRKIEAKLDNAVAAAYGWSDVQFDHCFRTTKQGVRLTISEISRKEIIQRLSTLNNKYFQDEVRQSSVNVRQSQNDSKRGRQKNVLSQPQDDFFSGENE